MQYPGGITGDSTPQYSNEQLVEIRRKLYGKDAPPTDLLEKLKEVHSSIDQVHSSLAISNCPKDIYNLLSPVMALAKLDLLDVQYLVKVLQNIADANKSSCELMEKEIGGYKKVVELKEGERREWADLCIRKQTFIESMYENATLGNVEEVINVLRRAIAERDKSNMPQNKRSHPGGH